MQIQPVTSPVALEKTFCSLHYAWCFHMYAGGEGARRISSHICPNSQALDTSAGSDSSHLKRLFLDSDNWSVYRMILVLLQVERPGEVQHVLR